MAPRANVRYRPVAEDSLLERACEHRAINAEAYAEAREDR